MFKDHDIIATSTLKIFLIMKENIKIFSEFSWITILTGHTALYFSFYYAL